MAHQALLRNKVPLLLFAVALLPAACRDAAQTPGSVSLNITTSGVDLKNGIYFHNKQPFTGCLFALQHNGRDTLFSGIFSNGKENGIQRKWYPDGHLSEVRYYEAGLKTGTHKGFWNNGKPKFTYHFDKDLYEGPQYKYYEDGRPYTLKNYKNGQEEGMQQEWNQQGNLTINYQAQQGRQYGNIGKKNCASMWVDSVYSKPRP